MNARAPTDNVLVRAEHVSKKFCKSLRRSLWYGVKDMLAELNPFPGDERTHDAGDFKSTDNIMLPPLRKNEFWAVRDVSFELKRGECLGLIGQNGAGKSTLLKMLNGLIKPDTGRIEIHGRVGALIELSAGFNPILTGRENIYSKGAVLGLSKKDVDRRFDAIAGFAEVEDFLDMPVQNYSTGMKIRLGFAVSAFIEPDVLLIDEVLAVGDLGFVIKCLNKVSEIMQRSAVIFVSHSMPMVARICTSVCLLEQGQIEFAGVDVPHGIERYIHKFQSSEREEHGSGTVRLTGIGVRSDPTEEFVRDDSFVFTNGDPLEFYLEFDVNESVREPVEVLVKILDQQLRAIIDCRSSATGDLFRTKDSRLKCLVRMDRVYLNRGRHSVTIGVLNPVLKTFHCRTTNTLTFFVRSEVQGWAASLVPGEWAVIS